MDFDAVKKQALDLAKSFLGAVAAASCLAALNWAGAHIPDAIQLVGTWAAAHGTLKLTA